MAMKVMFVTRMGDECLVTAGLVVKATRKWETTSQPQMAEVEGKNILIPRQGKWVETPQTFEEKSSKVVTLAAFEKAAKAPDVGVIPVGGDWVIWPKSPKVGSIAGVKIPAAVIHAHCCWALDKLEELEEEGID